jgi:hypothetical protein
MMIAIKGYIKYRFKPASFIISVKPELRNAFAMNNKKKNIKKSLNKLAFLK